MMYNIGFFYNNINDYLINDVINLYYFYYKLVIVEKTEITTSKLFNMQEIQNLLKEGTLNDNRILLNYSIYKSPYIDNVDFNKVISIYKHLFMNFRFPVNRNISQDIAITDNDTYYNVDTISVVENISFLRTGIIELQVVNSFLYGDKNIIKQALKNIISNIENENYMYSQHKDCWIITIHNISNYESYLKALMTNAGFYINKDLDVAFENLEFFVNSYREAIINSDYLLNMETLNSYSLDILNEKKIHNKLKFFSSNHHFLDRLFKNKTLLFLTPFKNSIDEIYNSKQNKNLEYINLITIETFLTTYPNKAHNTFKETFDYYCKKIDEEFSKNKIEIFTCSIGCYGMILCNYVKNKYNVTVLYIGHYINYYFGIISKRDNLNTNILQNLPNSQKISDLNIRYKNIEKIENNCYGI